jgi:hypothetical protein
MYILLYLVYNKMIKKMYIIAGILAFVIIGIIIYFVVSSDKSINGKQYTWRTGDWSPKTKDAIPCDNMDNCGENFTRSVSCYEKTSKKDVHDSFCDNSGTKPNNTIQCSCCNNHGSVNDGKCICDKYWTGEDCDKCTDSNGCRGDQLCTDGKCVDVKPCSNCKKTEICKNGKCISLCDANFMLGTYSGPDPPGGIFPPDRNIQVFIVTVQDDCNFILQNRKYPNQKPKLIINTDGTCTISALYMFNIAGKQNVKGSIRDGVITFPNAFWNMTYNIKAVIPSSNTRR